MIKKVPAAFDFKNFRIVFKNGQQLNDTIVLLTNLKQYPNNLIAFIYYQL